MTTPTERAEQIIADLDKTVAAENMTAEDYAELLDRLKLAAHKRYKRALNGEAPKA